MADGTKFAIVPVSQLLPGGVAIYGFLRGGLAVLQAAQKEGRQWVYADRGYFRATQGADHSGYFRLTRNAYQHDGMSLLRDPQRWARLALRIAPWRRGRHVLVCPPGDVFTRAVGGFAADTWLQDTLRTLRAHTDRPIRIRHKPRPKDNAPPLAFDLQDCHALVTYMSNTAVEAVLAGVPVFCTGKCAARAVGRSDLTQIEHPYYPDWRHDWAATLAANQWTLNEIRAGLANEVFK